MTQLLASTATHPPPAVGSHLARITQDKMTVEDAELRAAKLSAATHATCSDRSSHSTIPAMRSAVKIDTSAPKQPPAPAPPKPQKPWQGDSSVGGSVRSGKEYYDKWSKLPDQLIEEMDAEEAAAAKAKAMLMKEDTKQAAAAKQPTAGASALGQGVAVASALAHNACHAHACLCLCGACAGQGSAELCAHRQLLNVCGQSLRHNFCAGAASKAARSEHVNTANMRPVAVRRQAELEKTLGNEHFKQNENKLACEKYTKAIELAEGIEDADLTVKARTNRAATYHNMQMWQDAETDCTEALKLQPGFVKAYMRRAKARMQLKNLKGAMEDLDELLAEVWAPCLAAFARCIHFLLQVATLRRSCRRADPVEVVLVVGLPSDCAISVEKACCHLHALLACSRR